MKTITKRIVITNLSLVLIFLNTSCQKERLKLPTLTTINASEITQTTAISGGNITDDGGFTVLARGVCWSTNDTPSINDNKTTDGAGVGDFESLITGLKLNTKYYVRAYATTSSGTGYGMAISFTTKVTFSLGDTYLGGKIAYILQTGDPGFVIGEPHGLIAALSDQSTSIEWYNGSSIGTGAVGSGIGSGNANTSAIVSTLGEGNYAAKICSDLNLNGYSDWFLPSKDELSKLFINRSIIGGFSDRSYWSSTEYLSSYAYSVSFTNGSQNVGTKNIKNYVRAIRTF